jgi:hypothetical protein
MYRVPGINARIGRLVTQIGSAVQIDNQVERTAGEDYVACGAIAQDTAGSIEEFRNSL